MDNVLNNGQVIINGGNPIKDCPTNYLIADKWANDANKLDDDEYGEYDRPLWEFDCGFKLDFDGPILSFNSRFYPPKTHSGDKWDGDLAVVVMGDTVMVKHFECETLEELKSQVQVFTKEFAADLVSKLKG